MSDNSSKRSLLKPNKFKLPLEASGKSSCLNCDIDVEITSSQKNFMNLDL
jgi:hypothetical protein